MGDTDLALNSNENQFSKFVNEVPVDDFVEIPLISDGESDTSERCPNAIPQEKRSLVELEPVFPPQSDSHSAIQAFFEPTYTPSPKRYTSNLCSPVDGMSCQDLDDDVEDDFKFNEDLANAMRYQCSLFSPSLVRAINSDIKEIKRSLTTSVASEDDKPSLSQKQESFSYSTPFQMKESQNSRRIKNDEGGKKDALTVRQWNFAAPVNAIYSTSESSSSATNSDAEDSATSNFSRPPSSPPLQVASRPNDIDGTTIGTQDGEWSLKRCPPCPRTLHPPAGGALSSQSNKALGSSSIAQRPQRVRKSQASEPDYGSDEDTDQLLDKQYRSDKPVEIPELKEEAEYLSVKKRRGREVAVHHPDFPHHPIEGCLYRSRYLGSTQLPCEDHPSKSNRLHQAQEAVQRVKAPDGETQPSVPVELFVSTERILILNKDLDEIVMDHDLRLISYIADVGSILVLMVRRPYPSARHCSSSTATSPSTLATSTTASAPPPPSEGLLDLPLANDSANGCSNVMNTDTDRDRNPPKIICHLFESDETQIIAQAIGKAFHEAYFEFLRQSGVEDPEAFQERNYQKILHQQEIFRNELAFFADKEQEKEVIVPKQKGEALGVVIVESGWGSVLPTAVLANMHPSGPAARCGQLNIGNRIISINGQSLVGLPLTTCQSLFKATKNQTAVKLVIVNCSPVVEVLIRRPDQKFQLGFSVQDGVICSLLRGGIAERGGIRVDHRIIEINGESVVAVPHEYIVNLLATSVGEIYIRTMPTSIFRLLTGQDTPHYI
ncbi:Protein lin-10 [Taenia solium]|eukprot:TsM_000099700 transcript=TsM_000099700 gene=TsM_000099700